LAKFEQQSFPQFAIFRRPARFGKSTFLKMLRVFYDINLHDREFQALFQNLDIGNNPPAKKYMILVFDFTYTTKGTYDQLMLEQVFRDGLTKFVFEYANILGDCKELSNKSVIEYLCGLLKRCMEKGLEVFLMIDEVDAGSSWIITKLVEKGGEQYASGQLRLAKEVLSLCKAMPFESVLTRGYATGITTLCIHLCGFFSILFDYCLPYVIF
jgi:hypothetical protein